MYYVTIFTLLCSITWSFSFCFPCKKVNGLVLTHMKSISPLLDLMHKFPVHVLQVPTAKCSMNACWRCSFTFQASDYYDSAVSSYKCWVKSLYRKINRCTFFEKQMSVVNFTSAWRPLMNTLQKAELVIWRWTTIQGLWIPGCWIKGEKGEGEWIGGDAKKELVNVLKKSTV